MFTVASSEDSALKTHLDGLNRACKCTLSLNDQSNCLDLSNPRRRWINFPVPTHFPLILWQGLLLEKLHLYTVDKAGGLR